MATKEVIADYIKKVKFGAPNPLQVIETQISYSSSLTLRKDEVFTRRIKNLEKFILYLIFETVVVTGSLVWLFYYSGFTLVSLLAYPVISAF